MLFARGRDDRPGKRVLARQLSGGCKRKNKGLAETRRGRNADNAGMALGEGPGLVDQDGVGGRQGSSAAASFTRTPAWAPRPIAVTIETGVASPSAQGQAMIRTATEFRSAKMNRGSGPKTSHAANVIAANAATPGTNQEETRSTMRTMGGWLPRPPPPVAQSAPGACRGRPASRAGRTIPSYSGSRR